MQKTDTKQSQKWDWNIWLDCNGSATHCDVIVPFFFCQSQHIWKPQNYTRVEHQKRGKADVLYGLQTTGMRQEGNNLGLRSEILPKQPPRKWCQALTRKTELFASPVATEHAQCIPRGPNTLMTRPLKISFYLLKMLPWMSGELMKFGSFWMRKSQNFCFSNSTQVWNFKHSESLLYYSAAHNTFQHLY